MSPNFLWVGLLSPNLAGLLLFSENPGTAIKIKRLGKAFYHIDTPVAIKPVSPTPAVLRLLLGIGCGISVSLGSYEFKGLSLRIPVHPSPREACSCLQA